MALVSCSLSRIVLLPVNHSGKRSGTKPCFSVGGYSRPIAVTTVQASIMNLQTSMANQSILKPKQHRVTLGYMLSFPKGGTQIISFSDVSYLYGEPKIPLRCKMCSKNYFTGHVRLKDKRRGMSFSRIYITVSWSQEANKGPTFGFRLPVMTVISTGKSRWWIFSLRCNVSVLTPG